MKKNAPAFAYETVYGNLPKNRPGRYPGEIKEKIWKGIKVDYDLKYKWLNLLNGISQIEMRSSCAGHSKEWISFVIFRLKEDSNKKRLEKIKKELNSYSNSFCDYELGMENKFRIVMATDLWNGCEDQKKWESWWGLLAYRINKVTKK